MVNTEILEKTNIEEKTKLYKQKMYDVVFLNDDFTPFDFVVSLLVNIFGYDEKKAVDTTMTIHTEGRCAVGTFPYDIADQKRSESIFLARSFNFPLEIILEEKL